MVPPPPLNRSLKIRVIALIGVLVVTLVLWSSWQLFGVRVVERQCCGSNCWEVDDAGEPVNPDDAYCQTVTIDHLPATD